MNKSNQLTSGALYGLVKPEGLTSQGALNLFKRELGVKKAGHSGTLDPIATGVMVVATGTKTRLLSHVIGHDKRYIAQMRLGVQTDTGDRTGVVLRECDASSVDYEHVVQVVSGFTGEISQTPPRYSALRVGGRRAHELARAGEEFELAERQITISALSSRVLPSGEFELDVTCSSGTYIRTLIEDIGSRLGVGATMSALRRVGVGEVHISMCQSLGELEGDRPLAISSVFPAYGQRCVQVEDLSRPQRNGAEIDVRAETPLPGQVLVFIGEQPSWDGLLGVYENRDNCLYAQTVFPDVIERTSAES